MYTQLHGTIERKQAKEDLKLIWEAMDLAHPPGIGVHYGVYFLHHFLYHQLVKVLIGEDTREWEDMN